MRENRLFFLVPPPCYATANAYPGGGYASNQEAKLLMINPMELRSKRGSHSFCECCIYFRVFRHACCGVLLVVHLLVVFGVIVLLWFCKFVCGVASISWG